MAKKKKKYTPKMFSLDTVLSKFTKALAEFSQEYYPMPEDGKGLTARRFAVEYFDYLQLDLDEEDTKTIVEFLTEDNKDPAPIAEYVGNKYNEDVCRALMLHSEAITKEVLPQLTSYEQLFVKKFARFEELAYDWCANNYSCDLDVKAIVRSIMKSQNPFCLINISKQEFDLNSKKWKEVSSQTFPISEEYYLRVTSHEATSFFKDLGGMEYTSRDKTVNGECVVKHISTNPNKVERTVRLFTHDLEEYFHEAEWFSNVR